MKVEIQSDFQPIQITLENESDVENFLRVTSVASGSFGLSAGENLFADLMHDLVLRIKNAG